jgi:RNA polymerase sigma-70 factor, ECF subfamily
MKRTDPLANPAPLIRRVYRYVAYRLGDGPEAEDVTGEVLERAVRYRHSYDDSRGEPLQWLIGIARHCVNDELSARRQISSTPEELATASDLEGEVIRRVDLAVAIDSLDPRSRDLLALRYAADLTARQIGELVGLKTNAVEVALHRTLVRLRQELEGREGAARLAPREPASRTSP